MKHQFKVGDKVITKKGFTNECNSGINPTDGGIGYKEDIIFVINSVSTSDKGNKIAWYVMGSGGIYFQALELYNEEPQYEIY